MAVAYVDVASGFSRTAAQHPSVQNALVRVLKSRMIEGERTLADSITDWAQTDDAGEYRVFGLTPGRYYVNALPAAKPRIEGDIVVTPVMPRDSNNSRSEERARLTVDTLTSAALNHDVFVPVYYPGTTDATSAGSIDVGSGVVVSGIDLTVARTATYRVSGNLAGAAAPTGQNFRVRVTSNQSRNVATVARPLEIRAGTDLSGIDFQLVIREP